MGLLQDAVYIIINGEPQVSIKDLGSHRQGLSDPGLAGDMAGVLGSERETAGYTAVRVKVTYIHLLSATQKKDNGRASKGRGSLKWPTRLAVDLNVTPSLWPVQNFDPKTTDTKTLQDAFSSCGDVRSAILVKGLGGQSTGAGYIHFEDHQAAKVGWRAALSRACAFIAMHV